MGDDIVNFEVGFKLYLDGRDDPENDALGVLMFGAQWPRMKAKFKRSPGVSGGRLTVVSVDRGAGTITLGDEDE